MNFTNEDLAKFIEIVKDEENVTIVQMKKDVACYRANGDRRKTKKTNLHELCVLALNVLSNKHKVFVRLDKDACVFKVGKFKMESNIKNWINTIIFITLLKCKKDKDENS